MRVEVDANPLHHGQWVLWTESRGCSYHRNSFESEPVGLCAPVGVRMSSLGEAPGSACSLLSAQLSWQASLVTSPNCPLEKLPIVREFF